MGGVKLVWVAGLPNDYTVGANKYRATNKPLQVPEDLAVTLGLQEIDDPTATKGGGETPSASGDQVDLATFKDLQAKHDALQKELQGARNDRDALQKELQGALKENESLKKQVLELQSQPEPAKESPAPADPEPEQASTDLPDNFPGKKALEAAGITTLEAVKALSDEELIDIEGIGDATFQKIREAQA